MYCVRYGVFAARCYTSAAYAVMRCLSVCVSRSSIMSIKTNKHSINFFSPSDSHTIVVFPLDTPLRLSRNMLHGWKDNSVLAKSLAACTHLSATVSQLFEPQVPKTAVFTYRSPHFCFPWRRPCDYHAIYVAWMERQFIIIIIIIINLLAQKHDKVTRATMQIERDSKDTDATNSCRRKVQIKLVRNTLQK